MGEDQFTQPYSTTKIADIEPDGGGGGFTQPSVGTGNISVYFSKIKKTVDGGIEIVIQYIGVTNDMVRRAGEHGRSKRIEIIELIGNMSRFDAKAVEQVLIEWYDMQKNGGSLLNIINSISNKNPKYLDSIERGWEILKTFFIEP